MWAENISYVFRAKPLVSTEIHDWCCFQKWRNLLLTWDPEKYGGIKRVRINPSLIWIPDIVLYNRSVHGVTISNTFGLLEFSLCGNIIYSSCDYYHSSVLDRCVVK